MKKILLLVAFALIQMVTYAQCSMCKANAESSLHEGSSAAAGLNKGISYLILVPYMAAAAVGIAFYYHYKKNQHKHV
ncbi:MAG: hypothetical protein HYZ42_11555 [Bacteroidetes bacterium]|nr:hypothetical protein [Bacteroidota bacterium]